MFVSADAWHQKVLITSPTAIQLVWEGKRGGTLKTEDSADIGLDNFTFQKVCAGGNKPT